MSFLDFLLSAAFLFAVGSFLGWCLEVLFRRCFSAKKWINPGFLQGPYLPLYGFGVVGLYAIMLIPIDTGTAWLDSVLMILTMGVAMTVIEYIAGLIFIKGMNIKLWDYSNRWGNIQGIICPLFSLFWLIVAVIYYFVIDPYVMDAVDWFVHHISFAFVVGLFFGVFIVDLCVSLNVSTKIRKFAKEHEIVLSFEKIKENIKDKVDEKIELGKKKASFLFAFKTDRGLSAELEDFTAEHGGEKTHVIPSKKKK